LFKTTNMVTDSSATRAISSRSLADTGGVGGEHEHRRVHGLKDRFRLGGVVRVDRTGARGVYQFHPAGQYRCVRHDGGRRELPAVARVAPFGDKVIKRGQREVLHPAVAENGGDALIRRVTHRGGQGGQRRHPHRQHRPPQQRVDQRALAPLGLPRDQHPQPPLPQPPAQAVQPDVVSLAAQSR